MKEGRSLQAVVAELERQRASKRDFLADTRKIAVEYSQDRKVLDLCLPDRRFGITGHAMRQIEEHLGVPAKFADRLLAHYPDLLAYNLNELLHRAPASRLVRTLDNRARAFLSNSYRVIDNYEFAEAVLDVAAQFDVEVASCEVTESRLYIKVVRRDLEKVIGLKPGMRMGEGHNIFDRVRAAACFSNSEIGAGKLWFRPAVWTRECTNLAVWEQESFSKVHLGSKNDAGEAGIWEVLSDDTKRLSDAALWSQVRDLTAAALDGKLFEKQVAMLEESVERKIEAPVPEVMEVTAKKFQLTEGEKGGILNHLIEGGSLSQYGLHAAITRFSQDVQDYDRASELERLGGRIIELPQSEWRELARAA